MKKLSILAVLAVFVLGMAATASAADIKATGKWQIEATWRGDNDFVKNQPSTNKEEDPFNIEQRMRTAFEFIANENLKAVLDTQIGSANWGEGLYQIGSGRAASATTNRGLGANAGNAGNIMLRRGYLDFKWPSTKVNFLVGYQTVSLPAAFGGGSPIVDDQMAAAVMVAPINDNVKVLAGFTRLVDVNTVNTAATAIGGGGNVDAVFAAVPVDFKGYNITPFGMYATAGKYSTADTLQGLGNNATSTTAAGSTGMKAYWAGAAFTMTAFDPFKVMADFDYGKAVYKNDPKSTIAGGGREGYMYDIAVDYTGLSMMTPEAFFVYSSGESHANSSDGKSHRMPIVAKPQNWAVGSFFFGDRNFINGFPTQAGYNLNVQGFWTAGVSLKDIKLIDKLSHTVHLLYVKGTNAAETVQNVNGIGTGKVYGAYLTTKDSLWEADFNTKYMIYDELAVNLDLGYINASFNKDVWKNVSSDYSNAASKDAVRAALGLSYAF